MWTFTFWRRGWSPQHSTALHRQQSQSSPSPFQSVPGIQGAVFIELSALEQLLICWQKMLIRAQPLVEKESNWLWYFRNCWLWDISVLPKDRNVQFLVNKKEFDGLIWQQHWIKQRFLQKCIMRAAGKWGYDAAEAPGTKKVWLD